MWSTGTSYLLTSVHADKNRMDLIDVLAYASPITRD